MKAPYKYPYISMFIIGYYFLEHQGYYYKLRKYFGYPEVDEISYLVNLNPEKISKIGSIPNRLMLIYGHKNADEQHLHEMKSVARKCKEKKRSQIIFGEIDCDEYPDTCKGLGFVKDENLAFIKEGKVITDYSGPFLKPKILKFIRNLPSPENV